MPYRPSLSVSARRFLYLNGTIISRVGFSFILYFVVGIYLAILPIYIHVQLGYEPGIVGLIISAQYIATFANRTQAGQMIDRSGAKRTVLVGLAALTASGGLLLASLAEGTSWLALGLLVAGRVVLGLAESWIATGAMIWGIGKVGARHTTQVISWNGIATYGALALGAPLGIFLDRQGGMLAVALFCTILGGLGFLAAGRLVPTRIVAGERLPLRQVLWRVTPHGLGLALGGIGFGVLATFITLFYAAQHWPDAALSLSVFGTCFILVRLGFARQIDRRGGFIVAIISFAVETLGLACLTLAPVEWLALIGAALVGAGFSLVFPALGVEAVSRVAAGSRGAALGAYSVFIDVSMAVAGPLAGIIIAHLGGYRVAFATAAACSLAALALAEALRRRFRP